MPELPEVETVVRGLRKKITGRKITALEYRRANIRFPLPRGLLKTAPGQKIVSVERHSKYILILLSNGENILLHLGMSGRLLFSEEKNYTPAKHDHVIIGFAGGLKLIFNDARRFGVFDAVPKGELHRLQRNIGLDALSDEWDAQKLFDAVTKRKADMKAILMNQKIIAGLGNIYVSEALYRAKISPKCSGKKVTLAECAKLLPAIRAVLNEALEAGGSSLRDYVQTDGELGYFQNRFRVYGRDDESCRSCKTSIKRITQAGRSTFYCPSCQR
jgi:formamidopyrimidine-DNA glycosylase